MYILNNGFTKEIPKDFNNILKALPIKTYGGCRMETEQIIEYSLNGETISFPYRVYIQDIENEELEKLTVIEQSIIHCIYTRSCNGYVRERHLKKLLESEFPNWAIPYIVKVCDEYIVEILDLTYTMLKDEDTTKIKEFCVENKESFCLSYNRMISYWNEFYRNDCYRYKDYIGRKLFKKVFGYTRAMERK